MRRFSQRNTLVTLSDLNVTPLIDLAFVLLIIFMITTPLLEHGLSLDLPEGGQPDRPLDRNDIRTVEVDQSGGYTLDGNRCRLSRLNKNWLQIIKVIRIFWCTSARITVGRTVRSRRC